MNRESATNIFIANLSFGDIFVIGFALPFSVSDIFLYMQLFHLTQLFKPSKQQYK